MKLFLFGKGKMGTLVSQLAEPRGHTLVSSLKEAEVAIDFSYAEGVIDHLKEACAHALPLVIGTTGWESALPLAQELVRTHQIGVLYAPNFSLGVAHFRRLLKMARTLLSDYALAGVEWHHAEKRDFPSGTAKAIATDLGMTTPFAHVRAGWLCGTHQLLFDSPCDTLTFTHEAKNREGFALGALRAAEWLPSHKGWFTLEDMLDSI